MATHTYATEIFGETYSIRADFSEASCPIERDDEDGNWSQTGRQVADYWHWPEAAMWDELEQTVVASGDDPADYRDEIEAAIAKMTTEEKAE